MVATIPVGNAPNAIAYDSRNGDLYVSSTNDNSVSVIDGSSNTVVATIPVGNVPYAITYDPNNGDLYVANYGDNTVSVISGAPTP